MSTQRTLRHQAESSLCFNLLKHPMYCCRWMWHEKEDDLVRILDHND